jgi:glycine/D-amino acid oxidase-like deaminating enzyme
MKVGIVGGGIFGIAAALELRGRGHLVTVFDQGEVPNPRASSTDLSKAIRRIYGTRETYVELAERAGAQWAIWQERLGGAFYLPIGQFQIGQGYSGSSTEMGVQLLLQRGAAIEILNVARGRQRFPQFAYRDGDTCVWDGWAGYLASGEAVAALAKLVRAEGVAIRENAPVLDVAEDTTGVMIRLDQTSERFDRVVIATGVWLNRLVPEIGGKIVVTRQQMAFFEPVDPAPFVAGVFPTWVVDGHEGWYGHPIQRHGWVKVSNDLRGAVVDADAHRDATPDFLDQAREFVARRIPDLTRAKLVGSRSCFYANTPDHDFVIDWAPGRQRTLIAGGGSGHGFKFGGSLGPLIADALEETANPLGAEFRLGQRFTTVP